MVHSPIKPEKILPGFHSALHEELTLKGLFNSGNFDEFKGALGDKVTIRIPGTVGVKKDYQKIGGKARAERTADIEFETYAEAKVDLTLGSHAYSAVAIQDEQTAFDLVSADSLVPVQGRALAVEVNSACGAQIAGAPYTFPVVGHEGALRKTLIEARKVLNKVGVPAEQRILVVGSDFEAALLSDEKLTFASSVGDNRASAALGEATLGNLLGFRVVVSQEVADEEAYAFVPSAFVLRTATPPTPSSVAQGGSYSAEGTGLRWVRQYNNRRQQDESTVDLYYGTEVVKDVYRYLDTDGQEQVAQAPVFLRGVNINLDAASAASVHVEGDDTVAGDLGVKVENPVEG